MFGTDIVYLMLVSWIIIICTSLHCFDNQIITWYVLIVYMLYVLKSVCVFFLFSFTLWYYKTLKYDGFSKVSIYRARLVCVKTVIELRSSSLWFKKCHERCMFSFIRKTISIKVLSYWHLNLHSCSVLSFLCSQNNVHEIFVSQYLKVPGYSAEYRVVVFLDAFILSDVTHNRQVFSWILDILYWHRHNQSQFWRITYLS